MIQTQVVLGQDYCAADKDMDEILRICTSPITAN